ncbi:MAG: ABC transporter permease [Candidatus Brocadiae bacterium]|nr:ABC transporter permease [Candidatus Brocadiia bacterium]
MTALGRNLRAIRARAWIRVVAANRELSWLLFDTLLPALATAGYIFVYRALGAPAAYEAYVVLGGVMTAFWMNVLWGMAAQFFWEKDMGNLDIYMMAPISRMSILLGMAVGGMLGTAMRSTVILALGLVVFRIRFEVSGLAAAAGIFLLSLTALYGLGMMLSSLFLLFGRGAQRWATVAQEPVYLVSGFYFPLRDLGFPLAAASASLLPLALGLDAIRQTALGPGTGFLPVHVETAALAALAALFLLCARRTLQAMESRAKREGSLTLKWE